MLETGPFCESMIITGQCVVDVGSSRDYRRFTHDMTKLCLSKGRDYKSSSSAGSLTKEDHWQLQSYCTSFLCWIENDESKGTAARENKQHVLPWIFVFV